MRAPARVTQAGIEPLFLSVADTARRLGVSRSRIYELIADGEIRKAKDGAKTLLWRDDVDAWAFRKVGILIDRPSEPQDLRDA